MKTSFSAVAIAAIALASVSASAPATTTTSTAITAAEALEAARLTLPAGVILSGAVEELEEPSAVTEAHPSANNDTNDQWGGHYGVRDGGAGGGLGRGLVDGGGLGGGGGFGRCVGCGDGGGYGRFGWHRFRFSYRGVSGWAYPLEYWNSRGARLHGDECRLGLQASGLFYC